MREIDFSGAWEKCVCAWTKQGLLYRWVQKTDTDAPDCIVNAARYSCNY